MNNKTLTDDQIKQSVNYLGHAFKDAIDKYKSRAGDKKSDAGAFVRSAQEDFAYLIDDIQRGPVFFVVQKIGDANLLIERVNNS